MCDFPIGSINAWWKLCDIHRHRASITWLLLFPCIFYLHFNHLNVSIYLHFFLFLFIIGVVVIFVERETIWRLLSIVIFYYLPVIHVNEVANRQATANNQLKAYAANETQWNAVEKNYYDKIMQVRIHWVCRALHVQCISAWEPIKITTALIPTHIDNV